MFKLLPAALLSAVVGWGFQQTVTYAPDVTTDNVVHAATATVQVTRRVLDAARGDNTPADLLKKAQAGFRRNGIHIADADLKCMAANIFHEARGEKPLDQIRVANVVNNRVADDRWPNSICGVVYEPWQFSWTMDERINRSLDAKVADNRVDRESYALALEIAGLTIAGHLNDFTDNSTHYHAKSVFPAWALAYKQTVVSEGAHVFYR